MSISYHDCETDRFGYSEQDHDYTENTRLLPW